MDELVNRVSDRVGIGEDQARKAVKIVVGFLKERLPGPVSGQLEGFLGQGGSVGDSAKDFGSKFGL